MVGSAFFVARTYFGAAWAGYDFWTALNGASAEYPLCEFFVGLG